MRRLGALLGDTINALDGAEVFAAVEALRALTRRRRGVEGAPEPERLHEIITLIGSWELPLAEAVVRSFLTYFQIVNTAEETHRVRRRRTYSARPDASPAPRSLSATLRALRAAGAGEAAIAEAVHGLRLRPVLTAHPTESQRLTIQAKLQALHAQLLRRDAATQEERETLDAHIAMQVESLWQSDQLRHRRPTVLEETRLLLNSFDATLWDAVPAVVQLLRSAARDVAVETNPIAPVTLGSWMGGDRDGNPAVTPETTWHTALLMKERVLLRYLEAVRALDPWLTHSARRVEMSPELLASLGRNADAMPSVQQRLANRADGEPYRHKLAFMGARLQATIAANRQQLGAEDTALLPGSRTRVAAREAAEDGQAYASAGEFIQDLEWIATSLRGHGAHGSADQLVQPLIDRGHAFGFRLATLDIRDHAERYARAIDEIAQCRGIPVGGGRYLDAPIDARIAFLQQQLASAPPFLPAGYELSADSRDIVERLRVVRRVKEAVGPEAIESCIVSMASSAADILAPLLLAREVGLNAPAGEPGAALRMVPLLERLDDLAVAPAMLRSLFADPIYRRHLAAHADRQEVMIGYSDSAKEVGILPAQWGLYRAQEAIRAEAESAGIEVLFFHGRGGTVSRGGGPSHDAILALPPRSTDVGLKWTEQGEMIQFTYGLPAIASWNLEQSVAAALAHRFRDWRETVSAPAQRRYRETMDELAAAAEAIYRREIAESAALFEYFQRVTPIQELAELPIGSRPAFRPDSHSSLASLRAIPWVFGWMQSRHVLTGWMGVGTALREHRRRHGDQGLRLLREMYERWPFFAALLSNVEMVCAKADLEIAEHYVQTLGAGAQDAAIFKTLREEFQRTEDGLRLITGATRLLGRNPVLRRSIDVRNPYVDALSFLQVELIRRRRSDPELSNDPALLDAILRSINGVAAGLRNTG